MAFVNGAWPPFTYTHDVSIGNGGPYRAGVDDLGGDEHEDDDPQPEIGIEPTAAVTNEQNRHIAGLERVTELVRVWVQFSAGTPSVIKAAAMGTLVTIPTFTVNHPATGTVDVLWAIGAIAPQAADPACTSNSTGKHATGKIHPSPPGGYTGIRILITDLASAAADGDFQAAIY
jgi:hypothetical protein